MSEGRSVTKREGGLDARRLQLLAEAMRSFTEATSDLQSLLSLVVVRSARLLGNYCTVRLLSEDGKVLELADAHDPDAEALARQRNASRGVRVDTSNPTIAADLRRLGPYVLGAEDLRPLIGDEALAALGIRHVITAPMRTRGRTLGLLAVTRRGDSALPFDDADIMLAQTLADHAALCIDNARLIEASRASSDSLAQKEQTLRQTEAQLLHAQRMEALGRLAGGIAHDFNNLLSVIISYTELLVSDTPPTSPHAEDLAQVRSAAMRAANLTKQLLAFSRRQSNEPRPLDLNDVIGQSRKMLDRVLGEDVAIDVTLEPNLWKAVLDPGQVEQVVLNLAINARDAMPRGGKLVIETANVEMDATFAAAHVGAIAGPYVRLTVCDDGVGMDAATRDRIFEPFFTTKERGKGTGLGLSTVLGIVQQSAGAITVDSAPGAGTTFRLYFPRTSDAITPAPRPSVTPPQTLRGSETVLLVEDEGQLREVVREILERYGYNVLSAATPSEACAVFTTHADEITLLLTDVVLPEMDGFSLAERLVSDKPTLRTLFMSGYSDRTAPTNLGDRPVAHISKPFTPDALALRLRGVLDEPE